MKVSSASTCELQPIAFYLGPIAFVQLTTEHCKKRDHQVPFFIGGGEGGITQNSLGAVLTLRASPLTRLGAKYSLSRIWSNLRFSSLFIGA